MADRPGRDRPPLRQGSAAAEPEDGARDAGRSGSAKNRLISTQKAAFGHAERARSRSRWWTFPVRSDTSARSRLRARPFASPLLYQNSNPINERGCRVQVLVRDNNVDQALKALKKKMQREGIFREMKLRGHYEKPSEKKAREKA